jgi:hypothetical protein
MFITGVQIREVKFVKPFSIDDMLRGLPRPRTLSWLPPLHGDSDVAREIIAQQVPIDGSEVVEWMHHSASYLAVMDVFAQAIEDAGGKISFATGDAYIPGVRMDSQWYVRSEPGSTVQSRGYGIVVTPYGNVSVPVGGKRTIVFKDVLAWASLPWVSAVQWIPNLLRFDKLPKPPIKSKIPFPSTSGFVAPIFVNVSTRFPAPVALLKMNMTTDKAQTITLRGRSSSDYTNVLFEQTVDLDAGENEFTLAVLGFPAVPAFVLEIQPEDRTSATLNAMEVYP